ncbi:purine-nucleoside phosphorylase [Lipingzhangella sp. LS1_29]|uniref:Purine nucleoside phosphorylase n=1 Tax=Lipingzhangella rawalii TaxID=2055835 RepID=A0ABU2H5C8_9ACTN|nr:purine-nucleoside phosphorylase [Lipingzhangella rawalii]MDS1269824.1 purine-nucleoside phosphorylase [Lipingzhangella rawalii]
MTDTTYQVPTSRTNEAKELAERAAETLLANSETGTGVDAAIVLGSGWSTVADHLGEMDGEWDQEAAQLPGFVVPPTAGSSPSVRTVWIGAKRVLVFIGRAHLYEGHDAQTATHGVRTAIAAGAETVVLGGSCASLRADFAVGQPILISDHLNLTGTSPLQGAEFVDLSNAYSPRLRDLARQVDRSLAEGVYAATRGPELETPAEVRMLRSAGADLVGMSIALETIAAVEMGAEVLGCALVTNEAAGLLGATMEPEHVRTVGNEHAEELADLLGRILLRS